MALNISHFEFAGNSPARGAEHGGPTDGKDVVSLQGTVPADVSLLSQGKLNYEIVHRRYHTWFWPQAAKRHQQEAAP